MSNESTEKPPQWVAWLDRYITILSEDFLGGPKRLKFAWSVNLHKGMTAFVVLLLMLIYRNFSTAAWVYLALHGTYGFLWVLKSRIFPDQAWEKETSLAFGLVTWGGLSLYWIAPWLLVSRNVHAPGWYLALCISMYSFGVFTHFATDMPRYFCTSAMAQ